MLDHVPVELAAVVGSARMPVREVLKLGRGAVIALGAGPDDNVELQAGNQPVALATVSVSGERVSLTVTHLIGAR